MNETPSPNRRDFLATGAAAMTAGVLATGGAFAAGNDIIKIGLVGCGGRGSGAIADCIIADPGLKVVALGDAFEDRAKGKAEELKKYPEFKDKLDIGDRIFGGLDAYKHVIDSCDLVILATPPGFRPSHLEYAVKQKKNIFTEKPVGVDGPGIRKVLASYEEALANGLCIVAGTQRRHQDNYIQTIKKLHEGAIGEIVGGRCAWNNDGIWFRDRDAHQGDVSYQINNWYHFMWACGDHIVEQHVHNLDVMNWVLQGHPERCIGFGGRLNLGKKGTGRMAGDPKDVGNIYDHFAIEYYYPKDVRISSYCRHFPGVSDVSEFVVGTNGYSQVDASTINGKQVPHKGQNGYHQEHVDLIKAIREGKKINELKQVAESTLTAIMGRMAAYSGEQVTWKQALESKVDSFPKDLTWDMELPVSPVPIARKTKAF